MHEQLIANFLELYSVKIEVVYHAATLRLVLHGRREGTTQPVPLAEIVFHHVPRTAMEPAASYNRHLRVELQELLRWAHILRQDPLTQRSTFVQAVIRAYPTIWARLIEQMQAVQPEWPGPASFVGHISMRKSIIDIKQQKMNDEYSALLARIMNQEKK